MERRAAGPGLAERHLPLGTSSGSEIACRAVPTAKRERKKAGRQARLAALEAQRRRRTRVRQGAVLVVVAAVVIGIIVAVSNHGSSSAATGCPAANGSSSRKVSFKSPPPTCISTSSRYTANFDTDAGPFTVSLDTKQAPTTVNNFVFLARYHFYNGLTFHRVIPGFVVQGGDPTGTGDGGPGYYVKGEVPKPGSYRIGSVAMAKTESQPSGTGGSQFFIIVGQQGVQLPPQYSLVGQVTAGMPVVQKIAADGSSGGTPTVKHKMLNVTIT
jgi:cyclophilin family peptidyl-prolyl cis-trans isomerase